MVAQHASSRISQPGIWGRGGSRVGEPKRGEDTPGFKSGPGYGSAPLGADTPVRPYGGRSWVEGRAVGKGGPGRLESRPQAWRPGPQEQRVSQRARKEGEKPTAGMTAGVASLAACSTEGAFWVEERAVGKGGQGRLESRPQARKPAPHQMPAPQGERDDEKSLAGGAGGERAGGQLPARLPTWQAWRHAPRELPAWQARRLVPRRGWCGKAGESLFCGWRWGCAVTRRAGGGRRCGGAGWSGARRGKFLARIRGRARRGRRGWRAGFG